MLKPVSPCGYSHMLSDTHILSLGVSHLVNYSKLSHIVSGSFLMWSNLVYQNPIVGIKAHSITIRVRGIEPLPLRSKPRTLPLRHTQMAVHRGIKPRLTPTKGSRAIITLIDHKPVMYPATPYRCVHSELHANYLRPVDNQGQGDWTRTSVLLLPKQADYQAFPRPDGSHSRNLTSPSPSVWGCANDTPSSYKEVLTGIEPASLEYKTRIIPLYHSTKLFWVVKLRTTPSRIT